MKRQLAAAAMLALFASLASAGQVTPQDTILTINDDGSGFASGDMVTARFSANTTQFIGCGTRVYDLGDGTTYQWGFCQAGDAVGNYFTCFTENAALIDAMEDTADFAYLTFGWNDLGECTRVGFSVQSLYIPQFTDKKK